MVLGVQDAVLDAVPLEIARQAFRFLDGDGADEHRLPALVAVLDLFHDRLEFLFFSPVDDVGVIGPDHGPVGRDHVHIQVVNLGELAGLRVGGAHDDPFRPGAGSLDRLVQAVAPPAAGHQAAGELIHDDHLAVLDDIIHVPFVQRVSLERLDDMMDEVHVGEVVQIVDPEQLLDTDVALFGQGGGLGLFLDGVVLLDFELWDDRVDSIVEIGGLVRGA